MKKYFLHNGSENIGPFDIEELKEKKITKDTPVWYEGLEDWKDASEIEELKSILLVTPPPLTKKEAPQSFSETKVSEPKKKNYFMKALKIIAIVLVIYLGGGLIFKALNSSNSSSEYSYEESVMTIEEIEAQSPLNYLNASGTYKENFYGDNIKINGTISNSATMTTYKDVTVKVFYYSKTKTLLNTAEYMLYEFYPPNTTSEFKLKVENYNNVASLGWEVVNASVK
ncbi:DUF4339 domain-containing protein [Flavobacterium gelidilacus]|uniref:DUF4339 domain-containing protein n=1 Tax=Flavobacterium gelidilacus TaxID=206041 RepID=UPI000426608B|nr:DUF4339 domain-containing protein [Flavobacterium gelidilacus]